MNIDVDQMLYDDTSWLIGRIFEKRFMFERYAKGLDLRQRDWDRFWKDMRKIREIDRKTGEEKFEVAYGKRGGMWTKGEIEYASFYLGDPEIESNCCGGLIMPDGRCSDCGEHCGRVYVFN